jgi:MFS family permease
MAWRGLGLLIFILLKRPDEEKKMSESPKNQSFGKVVHDRSFTLYLFPWFMFNLIDIFERPVLNGIIGAEFLEFSKMVEPLVAILSIMLGGLLADRIGRKRVVIYGFVSLGVAYAVIGLANQNPLSWYFYMLIDGVAYGILWLIFLLVMWGDLSEHGVREKYYVIGTTPFLIAPVLPVIMAPLSTVVQRDAVLSLASFFLFLAVLPLMYAPETLPEKKIELRRLRGYLEQAKKLKDKHSGKS